MPKLDQFRTAAKTNVRIPPLPRFQDFLGKSLSESAARFDSAMGEWGRQLQRQLDGIAPEGAVTNTTVQQTIVNQASSASSGGGAQDSGLKAELDAHIASHVVHGTTSPVVGEVDEEALEAKTIGFVQPRNGKFRHVIQSSRIEADETFTIPVDYNMVVSGPFDVAGELIVEGSFAAV